MAQRKKTARATAAKKAVARAPKAKKSAPRTATGPAAVLTFARPFGGENAFNPKSMEKVMSKAQTQFVQFDKVAQEAASAGKESMDALTESAAIAQKGAETIMKLCMEAVQNAGERQSEAFKQILRCKTINEWTETNNRLAQETFEETMSQATRISELCVKTCTEAFEPINDQVSKAIKKASDTMAA